MDTNSLTSSPGGLYLEKRQAHPYRASREGNLKNPDVAERIRYALRGGFRTGTAIDTLPDLLIVFEECLKDAVLRGLTQSEALAHAQQFTHQMAEPQLSSQLTKIQSRAMVAMLAIDRKIKELQNMNGPDFQHSALYPTSVPKDSAPRSSPSVSVSGVMNPANTRLGSLVATEGPQDPSQVKFVDIVSGTLNQTFRLRKAVADGQGGFKPAPGFFFDVLFFELAEQARGGTPGSIVAQAGFRLSDEEGNVFADFKKAAQAAGETPSEQPTNIDFGD